MSSSEDSQNSRKASSIVRWFFLGSMVPTVIIYGFDTSYFLRVLIFLLGLKKESQPSSRVCIFGCESIGKYSLRSSVVLSELLMITSAFLSISGRYFFWSHAPCLVWYFGNRIGVRSCITVTRPTLFGSINGPKCAGSTTMSTRCQRARNGMITKILRDIQTRIGSSIRRGARVRKLGYLPSSFHLTSM